MFIVFRKLIHFELHFIYGMRQGFHFNCGYPFVIAPFVEENILSVMSGLGIPTETLLAIEVWKASTLD